MRMEKLILKCGRYVSPAVGDSDGRVRLMERYLARLTEELEYTVAEIGRTLAELDALCGVLREGAGTVVAQAVPDDREEGGV